MNHISNFQRFESNYPSEAFKEQVEKLVGFIKSGNSSQIIGIPGVGRSNLLGLLAYNRKARELHFGENQKNYHFVLLNFSEMRSKDEAEVLKFYFISIMDSLKERSMNDEYEKAKKLFKEALDIPDKQVLLQGLKKLVDYLSLEKNLTMIFLIDRFEDYIPFLTSEFFTDLRALRNRAKYKFSVVFSALKPLEDLLEPEIYVDFYEFLEGNNIYLPVKDEASLNFRIDFLQKNSEKKLPEETLNKMLFLTAGHGKLTRLCIEAVLSNNLAIEQFNNLADYLLSDGKVNSLFKQIWRSLTPSEQKSLLELRIINQESNAEKDYLEKVNLIKHGKISIPLFSEFIKKESNSLLKESEKKIILDETTNEIKQGETVLSETLTSAEFKLLSYLIANEGKILERDEIINAVWKDLSSTAGVTEQALDQLIFRLRKKIEDNPNSPTHIQTVKGRGFKFTS
jgi:hypothetical protein